MMHGDDAEYLEAIRLVGKFFPLAKSYVDEMRGLEWESMLTAMQLADYHADYSCDPFRAAESPMAGFAEIGGHSGSASESYARLLRLTGYAPRGRAIVVPEAIGRSGWCSEDCRPFVCDVRMVAVRLGELDLFNGGRDSLFVFESGEVILVDHDDRVHWAK